MLISIFAVLVLQFRSLTQPLIVFSAIPFAFIGSILFLHMTGWSFPFFAFVGFTSLVGIALGMGHHRGYGSFDGLGIAGSLQVVDPAFSVGLIKVVLGIEGWRLWSLRHFSSDGVTFESPYWKRDRHSLFLGQ